MRKTPLLLLFILILSCGRRSGNNANERIITVSIPPFKYFVEAIAGDDFRINIMVPAGSDPHVYEPAPGQIKRLSRSEGYISNGYLGFEMSWLDRFYDTNRMMKRMSLGNSIDPIENEHHHDGDHVEGADPHYWVSPKCAISIASSVKNFLIELNPVQSAKYEENYQHLVSEIRKLDEEAENMFSGAKNRSFMIYHPNLAYIARDYGLREIPVEYEGKEPTPSRMKALIDMAKSKNLKTIFVQREYDTKNARSIANEIGAELTIIDPLSENWLQATRDILKAVDQSLN